MKKILTIFVAMLMLLSFPVAFAEDNDTNETVEPVLIDVNINDTDDNETDDEDEEDEEEVVLETVEGIEEEAGITPDSPLWGIERALERIQLKLTIGKSAKAKRGLAHAEERLLEVQKMIAEKKLEEAAKAQEEYEETMEEVSEDVEELGNGDAEEELEEVTELEKRMEVHAALVERIGELKLKTKGLTDEQKASIDEIAGKLGEGSGKMQLEIMQKKDRVKIKIKAKGLTDEEIEDLVDQAKGIVGKDSDVKVIGKGNGKDKENKGKDKDDDEVEIEIETEDDDDDEVECVEDADCEEGRSCIEGDCEDVDDSSDEDECVEDADCDADEVCTAGDCEDAPADDESDDNSTNSTA